MGNCNAQVQRYWLWKSVELSLSSFNLKDFVFLRHPSEQYRTCSQNLAHFFRQAKGRLQTGQTLVGMLGFL